MYLKHTDFHRSSHLVMVSASHERLFWRDNGVFKAF